MLCYVSMSAALFRGRRRQIFKTFVNLVDLLKIKKRSSPWKMRPGYEYCQGGRCSCASQLGYTTTIQRIWSVVYVTTLGTIMGYAGGKIIFIRNFE